MEGERDPAVKSQSRGAAEWRAPREAATGYFLVSSIVPSLCEERMQLIGAKEGNWW